MEGSAICIHSEAATFKEQGMAEFLPRLVHTFKPLSNNGLQKGLIMTSEGVGM